jgi:hypothetical protein
MPITAEKAAALKLSIANALNPPEPTKFTPEEFGAYVGELTEHMHEGEAHVQTARAEALKAAGEALEAAEKAGAEVVEVVRFDAEKAAGKPPKPAESMTCPSCGAKMTHKGKGSFDCTKCKGAWSPGKAPAAKGDETPAAEPPAPPAAPTAPAPDPLAIAKANFDQMKAEAEVLQDVADGIALTPEQREKFGQGWLGGNLNSAENRKRLGLG